MLPSPQESLVALNLIPGLGSIRIQALLEFFGSAEHVLAAPSGLLARVPRIGESLASAIADWRNCTNVELELQCAQRAGVRVITLMDEAYPAVLRRMPDPPVVLYVLGEFLQEDAERAVSVVGSRMATPYGMSAARRFGRELANAGCTIVSGMARGIDTAAHWGALDADGRTIAVLGNGLSQIYPPENADLARRMIDGHGAIVSEFPMNMRPGRMSFPQRNRIVAAWSRATMVVEAPSHSGALHTARVSADEYGNTVFALPGQVDRPSSVGCHALIRDGAVLCTCPAELLGDMGWAGVPRQLELFKEADNKEQAKVPAYHAILPATRDEPHILSALAAGHDTLDALCSALGLAAAELTPQLMRLQVRGCIMAAPGGRYVLPKKD